MASATATPTASDADTEEEGKGGKLKKILIIVVLLVVVGGAVWYFMLRKVPEAAPVEGTVVALDPIQINLDSDHYLSIGIALQMIAGAEDADGSKALDAVIELFSGHPVADLNKNAAREKLKDELEKSLEKLYEGDVMDVYFTQFVTQ